MNVIGTQSCFGCGVCAAACKQGVLGLKINTDGFYVPEAVNPLNCIDCGLCYKVCSYKANRINKERRILKAYGAWSTSSEIRMRSTSGGVAFTLGKFCLENGYKVISVKYDPRSQKCIHYISDRVEDLLASQGSKYLQSYSLDAIRNIDRNQRYLVIGMPCHIDSLGRYVRLMGIEDNFILVDFFCHGVPSYLLWSKYLKGKKNVVSHASRVDWRNKMDGWQNSYNMCFYDPDGRILARSSVTENDSFLKFFLNDSCLNPACYDSCKFKYNQSSADIRIGDAWGEEYINDEKGVNIVLSFSDRGENLLHESELILEEKSFESIANGQMQHSAVRPEIYKDIMTSLKSTGATFEDLVNINGRYEAMLVSRHRKQMLLKHPFMAIKKILHKF